MVPSAIYEGFATGIFVWVSVYGSNRVFLWFKSILP